MNLRAFDSFVSKVRREWKTPGVAVAIVHNGKVVLSKGYGLRDTAHGLAVTPRTLFAIASCSKAFTTMALGLLVDEKELCWDKPVRDYVPGFRLKDPIATERATARDLACHRIGLPRHDLMWYGSSLSRRELFDRLRHLEPNKEFRCDWQYQNGMYMAAGVLIEHVAGCTYEEFVRSRIFNPLGMSSSNLTVTELQRADDFAQPYAEVSGKVTKVCFRNMDAIGPAGSINSSVAEMTNWLLLHLGNGNWKGNPFVNGKTLATMHAADLVVPIMDLNDVQHSCYGRGWFVQSYRGHKLVSHGGGVDGFSSGVYLLPGLKLGIVVLANRNGIQLPFIIAANVFDRALKLAPISWTERMKAYAGYARQNLVAARRKWMKARKSGTRLSRPMHNFAGDFENPGYGLFSIKYKRKKLKAIHNGLVWNLEHYHFDVFGGRIASTNSLDMPTIPFSFNTDVSGEIGSVAIKLEEAVEAISFRRVTPKLEKGKHF